MTDFTATYSVGRELNPNYVTADTRRPSHDDVVRTIRRMADRMGVTILATADGIGEYDGETEPCTIAMVTGHPHGVRVIATALAEHARTHWAQECIGYVCQAVTAWHETTRWPTGEQPC